MRVHKKDQEKPNQYQDKSESTQKFENILQTFQKSDRGMLDALRTSLRDEMTC